MKLLENNRTNLYGLSIIYMENMIWTPYLHIRKGMYDSNSVQGVKMKTRNLMLLILLIMFLFTGKQTHMEK